MQKVPTPAKYEPLQFSAHPTTAKKKSSPAGCVFAVVIMFIVGASAISIFEDVIWHDEPVPARVLTEGESALVGAWKCRGCDNHDWLCTLIIEDDGGLECHEGKPGVFRIAANGKTIELEFDGYQTVYYDHKLDENVLTLTQNDFKRHLYR
jgi:hypothetical protein